MGDLNEDIESYADMDCGNDHNALIAKYVINELNYPQKHGHEKDVTWERTYLI